MVTKIKHDPQLNLILEARHHNPFAWLGQHQEQGKTILRSFLPYAGRVWVQMDDAWEEMPRSHPDGLYTWQGAGKLNAPCLLRWEQDGRIHERHDPYTFPSMLSEHDLYLFSEGRLRQAYNMLGSRMVEHCGVPGTRFAVWAPNAERVSIIGDFNRWDGRIHPMRAHGSSGVWEIFIPGIGSGNLYKFELRNRHSGHILVKADPYGVSFEMRPGTAAKVVAPNTHHWKDAAWMEARAQSDWLHKPFNLYEMHAGSWQRGEGNLFLNFRELSDRLVPYLKDMGYTHVELMPVSEHPLDESWGYQTTGYFGVTSRFGTPDDFRHFVDTCHQAGIGVILDWVPAHFPKDSWALARFDGTALYEHEDPRIGEHQDWGTYIFNYGRNEVRNFLVSNAHYWMNEFHIDGLRVDAVASMIYLDYSRQAGEWLPNKYGGRENLEALEFIKELNMVVHEEFPGALTIAEESTAWPMISRPVYLGGLGFSMKWNMGWMNDTLEYMSQDPVHRRYHHNQLTFGQLYAYSENFVLPFSHDEVVHGKRSLLDKMPGDSWQKFANLRLLLTYQMTYPGKKLNFMGNEFGQGREWAVSSALDWHLLGIHWHSGIHSLTRDLNHLYRNTPALYELDFSHDGFAWIDCHDADQSIIGYQRRARDGSFVVVVLNFTPVQRHGYRIGVPEGGGYREIFNSNAELYGGSNTGNGAGLQAEDVSWMGYPHSLVITAPPLAGIIIQREVK
ncbi:MAG: 1,4-alpha-glucan branching enzyme [Methylophilales bacterium RIFCSPHIGHO2_02_FULL_57_10]|nr:MAG: 1,4-alpha-glucan branching enzyme [Methylophilales bacterium RIFCSPHIGHO2_02_FULL_57_10]